MTRTYPVDCESLIRIAELQYLGVKEQEEEIPQPTACPNCAAPNKPASPQCLRYRLPLTEEEATRQQQTAVLEVVESLRATGALQEIAERAVQAALRKANRERQQLD
ncbi:MAG: hypothetical protein ACXABV_11210 [Candidatus Thorarchaeota archaeon]